MENYIEKTKKRSQTRYELIKKKKACSKYYWLKYIDDKDEKSLQKQIGKLSHNPKVCSCWMCGNPRRKYKGKIKGKMTLAEIRNSDAVDIKKYLKYEI